MSCNLDITKQIAVQLAIHSAFDEVEYYEDVEGNKRMHTLTMNCAAECVRNGHLQTVQWWHEEMAR